MYCCVYFVSARSWAAWSRTRVDTSECIVICIQIGIRVWRLASTVVGEGTEGNGINASAFYIVKCLIVVLRVPR